MAGRVWFTMRSCWGDHPESYNNLWIFYFNYCRIMVRLRPSSSIPSGCVVLLKGSWAIFCHAGSERVGRMWSAREESLEMLRHGWGLNPGYGEDRQWDLFILPLSCHDPGHREDRQWDTFILPLSYHDRGHGEDRQWDTFILPLRAPGPQEGHTVKYIYFPAELSWPGPRTVRCIHSPTELSWPGPRRGQPVKFFIFHDWLCLVKLIIVIWWWLQARGGDEEDYSDGSWGRKWTRCPSLRYDFP